MSKKRHRHEPQQTRRDQFIQQPAARAGRTSWNTYVLAAGFLLVGTIFYVTRSRSVVGPQAASTAGAGGDVTFALSEFDDGVARFYRYTTAWGREIRFFVLKSSDGVVRAALDACDVCFRERRGYRQAGDLMVCNNCGQTFPSVSINEIRGGCNPVPIDRLVQGDRLVLPAASLNQGSSHF